jgi:hypothetical protein
MVVSLPSKAEKGGVRALQSCGEEEGGGSDTRQLPGCGTHCHAMREKTGEVEVQSGGPHPEEKGAWAGCWVSS